MTTHLARRRRAGAMIGAAVVAFLVAVAPSAVADAAPAQASGIDATFTNAARSYDVPKNVLVAIGYSQTRLIDHHGLPSQDNGYGVMHLADNPHNHTLTEAAALTGLSTQTLRVNTAANIRGAAAVLDSYARQAGIDRSDVGAWYPVVARYAGASTEVAARMFADDVYSILGTGAQPKRGPETLAGIQAAGQYPPSRWVPANGGNYRVGRTSAITAVVIHVTQGSYAGTISWFQNPSAGVSAHYVIRSSDGDITQMVREEDTGYHARNANPYSVGIEHEGFVAQPSWFTDVMYRASAGLTRYLTDKWRIPRDRAHIIGHNEAPGNDHTDPGPHWNWNYYMSLVNSGGGGGGKMLAGSPTDFTGDGKDDIVAFNQGSLNDVFVATSNGAGFAGTSVKWNDFFGLNGETLLTGDFNGDGKDDIVTFTGGTLGDVYVGLSTGAGFLGGAKWHDWFAPGAEVAAVGDVNGDGKDDIVTFTGGTLGDVYVALSTGTSFGPGQKWHEFFAPAGEFPAVGDVNGDGKADIITFFRGPVTSADVYVALSNGAGFGAGQKWHDLFAVGAEQPRVGDFNGDGKADIATFTCDANADVYVALSTGATFAGTTIKWNDFFCTAGEFPYIGDYNGDGRDDIVVFTKAATNDVYVGLSTGSGFLGGAKWHDFFGLNGETTL